MNEVAFSQKDYMQDAVMRQLAIIGEAARRIPNNIRSKQQEIPWRKISDFRNVYYSYCILQLFRKKNVVKSV